MQQRFPPRRWVPFTLDMHQELERLRVVYPAVTRTRLTVDALRRGMAVMAAEPVPTLLPADVAPLRRVG
ncbi:MAG TPA: hypothetical protein VGK73_32665 [Polyangiaceae bacterium]